MSNSHLLLAALSAALLTAPLAVAQEKSASAAADPADARASVAPLRYASAFDNYRPFGASDDEPHEVWRAANRQVGELGGHAGHVAQEPAEPRAQSAPQSADPASSEAGAPPHTAPARHRHH